MGTLILLRHGQSQWNLENRFTGWSDVPLTEQGTKDAATVGQALAEFTFDCAFTSRLIRAQNTLSIILTQTGQINVPVIEDSALNERHYGDLQGLNKAETAEKYGQDQVTLWRRSYSTRPPNGESVEDCERRTWPFFKQYVFPHILNGETVIIAAHGNSLRPIIKNMDGLTGDEVAVLEIGLCTPYIYKFDGDRMVEKQIREVEGIVTLGASQTQKNVEGGRV
ncbi:2,3-diphosphoglycerate-dependent phosphoglycerate mutase [Candidatus Peribacteria bacterium]|nr:MAG: 2,3-diphosphoglycerate-dependent phosphoglycerate mutase [Candidatus Peribacteria bacterium]